jgi:5-methylthioadenosine/S-adenosylhomocysteine deaminase
MRSFPGALRRAAVFAMLGLSSLTTAHAADDWTIVGTVLAPGGLIPDGAISVSKEMITAVGSSATIPSSSSAIKVPGVILPGFIDLHNHLTWNVLPRWVPARKFNNRYEWQDTAEYDRALVAPHNIVLAEAACETQIYAEVKAIVGGATSVLGGLLKDAKHPDNLEATGLLDRSGHRDQSRLGSAR